MYFSKLGFQWLNYWLWQIFIMRNVLSHCRLEIMNIAGESQQLPHARYMSFLSFSLVTCPLCVTRRLFGAMSETGSLKNCKAHKGHQHHADITDIKVRLLSKKEHGEITEWEMSISVAYSCNLGLGKCVDYMHEWLTLSHQYRPYMKERNQSASLRSQLTKSKCGFELLRVPRGFCPLSVEWTYVCTCICISV